jgi:hypothetical protein
LAALWKESYTKFNENLLKGLVTDKSSQMYGRTDRHRIHIKGDSFVVVTKRTHKIDSYTSLHLPAAFSRI